MEAIGGHQTTTVHVLSFVGQHLLKVQAFSSTSAEQNFNTKTIEFFCIFEIFLGVWIEHLLKVKISKEPEASKNDDFPIENVNLQFCSSLKN